MMQMGVLSFGINNNITGYNFDCLKKYSQKLNRQGIHYIKLRWLKLGIQQFLLGFAEQHTLTLYPPRRIYH